MTFISINKQFVARAVISLAMIAFAASINTAQAAPTVRLSGQATVVSLSQILLGALTSLGVQPSAVGYSALFKGQAYFPISSGAIDTATAKGEILHSGGLRLVAGSTRVELTDFIIDTISTPRLTGLVTANGDVVGRIPLFNLGLPQLSLPLAPHGRRLIVPNVTVTLTQEAANALNGAFNINAFHPGFNVGEAKVSAWIRGGLGASYLHLPRPGDDWR